MHINPFGLLKNIFDHNCYKNWMPFCYASNTVKQISHSEKIIQFTQNFPVLSKRENIMHGFGINRVNIDNTIIIIAYSIDKDIDFQKTHNIKLDDYVDPKSIILDIPVLCF